MQGSVAVMSKAATMGTEFIKEIVDQAVEAARAAGVPLYCGEFGVIDRAPTPDTLRWFTDTISVFDEYGIAHAMWTYKKMDFGLIDSHYEPIRDDMIRILTGQDQ